MASAKLLVVDDDPWMRTVITAAVERQGYEVVAAKDGAEGLALAAKTAPDVVITDVLMPVMDGWSFVRQLRSQPRFALVPVLFLTSLSQSDDRIYGYRLGADDYIEKPFRGDELLLRVQKVLAQRDRLAQMKTDLAKVTASTPPRAGAVLTGSLAEFGLATVLNVLEIERRTGTLEVTRDGRGAKLYVRDGGVIAAEIAGDSRRGEDAVMEVFAWQQGSFDFTSFCPHVHVEITTGTSGLLMEAARRLDEARREEQEAAELEAPHSARVLDRDRVMALRRDLGDESTQEILSETMSSAATTFDRLIVASAAGDVQMVTMVAHELKGMSATAGLAKVAEVAGRVEKSGRLEAARLEEAIREACEALRLELSWEGI